MSFTFKDHDGDLFQVAPYGDGELLDITVNGDERVTFYAADAPEFIKLIQQAAEAAA